MVKNIQISKTGYIKRRAGADKGKTGRGKMLAPRVRASCRDGRVFDAGTTHRQRHTQPVHH